MSSSLDCFFLVGEGRRDFHRSLYYLNYDSTVIDFTENEAFLLIEAGRQHGLMHGFWLQHRSWTTTEFLAAAWIMDSSMAPDDKKDY